MKPIRFVYDFGEDPKRALAAELLDSLVDPILELLPGACKSPVPEPDALNVRFWTNYDRDVFCNHGISDKNYRNAASVRQFPYIFHSGPYWQRRYLEQGIPAHQLRQVGYTKMDPLFAMVQERHTVLWAPTWAVLWQSAYDELARYLAHLGVESSPHCLDKPNHVTLSELVDADVVIADGGSTIYEAWALGKPVVFPDFAVEGLISPGSLEEHIYRNQIGYHATDPADLERTIETARERGITQAEVDLIDDVFPPELRGTSAQAHADALAEIAS